MALVAGAFVAPKAQAGEWVSSVEWVSGQSKGSFSGVLLDPAKIEGDTFSWDYLKEDFTDHPTDYPNGLTWLKNAFDGYYSGGIGSSYTKNVRNAGSASASGSAKIVWEWRPRLGETNAGPVPAELNYVVGSRATGIASNRVDSPNRDQSREEVKAQTSLSNPEVDEGGTVGGSYKTVTGSKIFRIETQGSARIESETFSLSASGSIPGDRFFVRPDPNPIPNFTMPEWTLTDNFVGNTSANISLWSSLDNRTVEISRTFARKQWKNPGEPNTRHSDTTYSYAETLMKAEAPEYDVFGNQTNEGDTEEVTENRPNIVELRANFSGNWESTTYRKGDLTYSGYGLNSKWSPPSIDDDEQLIDDNVYELGKPVINAHKQEMPPGSRNKKHGAWIGEETGSAEKIITFEVKDKADDAWIRAKHVLHLHDEIENIVQVPGDHGKFSHWEQWGTDIPAGGLDKVSGDVFHVTRNKLPVDVRLAVGILNITMNTIGNGIGDLGPGGWLGKAIFDEAYGNVTLPDVQDGVYPETADANNTWEWWKNAKRKYVSPNDPLETMTKDGPEPAFIVSINPDLTPGVQAGLSSVADDAKAQDQLWLNAKIVGLGKRTYLKNEKYSADQYDKAGFIGTKSFIVPKTYDDDEIGLFTTYSSEQQEVPQPLYAPSEDNPLEGAPAYTGSSGEIGGSA